MRIDLFSMMLLLLLLIVSDLINLWLHRLGFILSRYKSCAFDCGARLCSCVVAPTTMMMMSMTVEHIAWICWQKPNNNNNNITKTSGRAGPGRASNVINWNVLFTFDFVAVLSPNCAAHSYYYIQNLFNICIKYSDANVKQLPSFSNMHQSIVVRLLFSFWDVEECK